MAKGSSSSSVELRPRITFKTPVYAQNRTVQVPLQAAVCIALTLVHV